MGKLVGWWMGRCVNGLDGLVGGWGGVYWWVGGWMGRCLLVGKLVEVGWWITDRLEGWLFRLVKGS